MTIEFIAYAGRPWPLEQDCDVLRQVGTFASLDEAWRAFRSVEFVPLPTLKGRLRWRGWSPQLGMIIQIERPVTTTELSLAG